MIFKTFNSDIDKISSKWGMFGKSFNDIGTAIRNKIISFNEEFEQTGKIIDSWKNSDSIWSKLYPSNKNIKEQLMDVDKLIPEIDESKAAKILEFIKSIEDGTNEEIKSFQELYDTGNKTNQWIAEYAQSTKDQIRSTEGVIKTNQQARASALAHNEAIKAQTFSAKAGKVALQGLAMAGNMIVMWAVSKVVSGLYELSQVSENVAESAKELGDSFKNTSSDIEGYKSKIEELYKVINDEGSSIEDVINAHKSLMSVQDELIDKFGTEKGVINDVTDAINGQTGALDRLSNAKWQEVKNEFNGGGFWNDISNSLGGYSDNIDRMIDEYEDYHARIRLNDFINKDSLLQVDAFKSLLENNFDAEITFDASEGSEIAMLSGNANEIYEKLLDIQNLADQFHFSDSFENSLTKLANSARETSDKYKDFYNQYILYEKILTEDSDYVNTFKDITDAYEEYRNAFISNDESKIKQAIENYAKVLTDATSTATANSDSDVAAYFENMYPELQSTVEGWKFNVAFDANTDDLQGKIQSVLNELKDESGRSLTTEEILGLGESNEQYQTLISIAHSYNMTLEEMIELLKERNLVSAMDYQGLVSLFGQENVDKLSPEDLEIAYTIKNVGNMTFEQLQSEIQKTKETADEMGISSLSITQTIDQLNTQLKPAFDSLKSAYQDIFTSDGFDPNNIDILSTCDSIKSKLDEMSDPEGLNLDIDYSAYEDFAKVLSDSESDATDVQGAFDKLATSIVHAGLSGTEDFETLKAALGDLGVVNNEIIAFQELCQNTEALKEAGLDLKDASKEQMEVFVDEAVSAENATQALAYLELCKELVNGVHVETQEDINRIISLAQTAGFGAEALDNLTEARAFLMEAEASGDVDQINEAKEAIRRIVSVEQQRLASFAADLQYTGADTSNKKSKGSSSVKDTTETFDWIQQAIEKVEKEVQKLDDTVNSSYSTFSQKNKALAQEIEKVNEEIGLQQKAYEEYMQKAESVGLSDDYKVLVRDGAINIENISNENLKTAISDYQEWYEKAQSVSDAIFDLNEKIKDLHVSGYELKADRLEELLDSESIIEKQYLTEMEKLYKEYYENQVEYAQKAHEAKLALLDKEKSYLNSVANAASSLLDKEIDKIQDNAKAQESIYQEQIDLLNKKKKPLQDELDALEDKAKEEDLILDLQKKQYELKHAENQRDKFIYKDGQMIYTNDEQNVRNAQKDVDDAQLELQKYEIQKQIDALDEEIDRYNDLIDAVNESADNQVDALEKIKNKWQEVIDQQEYAQNLMLLTGEFGADAITKILTGSDDDLLAQWKNSYISTLADIDMESQGYIGDMTNQIASLYGIDLSPLQNQFGGVKNSVSDMTDALGEATSAIGIGNTDNNASDNQDMYENGNPQSSPTENSLKSAIENETATAIRSFDQHTDKLNNEVIPAIQSATAEMENFNETADMDIEKTVTINYVVNGDGNAYAEGTKGLTHDEHNALVSEYGQEELTVFPNGKTVLSDEPTMMDLPKGTVVYNEQQTKKIKNSKPDTAGTAYNKGTFSPKPVNNTDDGTIITPDRIELRPLQPGDEMYDLMQKWNTYMESINYNTDLLATNSMYEHNKQMHETINQISNASVVNNKNVQPVINNEIHVVCPGVTSEEVARQLPGALNKAFNGFSNFANQQSRIR